MRKQEIAPGKLDYFTNCGDEWLEYKKDSDVYLIAVHRGLLTWLVQLNGFTCAKNGKTYLLNGEEYASLISEILPELKRQRTIFYFIKYRVKCLK